MVAGCRSDAGLDAKESDGSSHPISGWLKRAGDSECVVEAFRRLVRSRLGPPWRGGVLRLERVADGGDAVHRAQEAPAVLPAALRLNLYGFVRIRHGRAGLKQLQARRPHGPRAVPRGDHAHVNCLVTSIGPARRHQPCLDAVRRGTPLHPAGHGCHTTSDSALSRATLAGIAALCALNGLVCMFLGYSYYEAYWRSDVRSTSILIGAAAFL